jgi:hypothetical protein
LERVAANYAHAVDLLRRGETARGTDNMRVAIRLIFLLGATAAERAWIDPSDGDGLARLRLAVEAGLVELESVCRQLEADGELAACIARQRARA